MLVKIKHHACHDCPRNTRMCKSSTEKLCRGYFEDHARETMNSITTDMARQAMAKKWDGKFRFPRCHINGKSLEDYSLAELYVQRNYNHQIWAAWFGSMRNTAPKDRPLWPDSVRQAHDREVDITKEISRRYGTQSGGHMQRVREEVRQSEKRHPRLERSVHEV